LVFLDESGAKLALGRSHAWLPRGAVLIEPRPMNWGDNLTMVGAIRVDRWLALGTYWGAMNREWFVTWIRWRLVPKPRRGDVVVLDNLPAHKAREVEILVTAAGARLIYLPPYSPRSQPDRVGVGALQETYPTRGPACRRDPASHRTTRASRHPSAPLSQLVRPCRIRISIQAIYGVRTPLQRDHPR
jgi:hypothetical protein